MQYIEYLEMIDGVGGLDHKVWGKITNGTIKEGIGDFLRSLDSIVYKMLLPNMFSSIQVVTSSYLCFKRIILAMYGGHFEAGMN